MRLDGVQERLHLREGERVDLRLLLLEPANELTRVIPQILPAHGVVEDVLHRHHDVVLPLPGERSQLVEELLDVAPPDLVQRHPPKVRDGVDFQGRLVVPPCGLGYVHLLPLQPLLCVLGEGGSVRIEDPQVLPRAIFRCKSFSVSSATALEVPTDRRILLPLPSYTSTNQDLFPRFLMPMTGLQSLVGTLWAACVGYHLLLV